MAAKRTEHRAYENEASLPKPCALLWDESFLWGVMARRALREAGLSFDLIRSEEVCGGALSRYRMLFVPGGWAANKLAALGERGGEEIRRFVAAGGSYLGICGGAGMATQTGLGLLPIGRKPSNERVPSFSGPICLACDDHAIWRGIDRPLFCAWWPSQFQTVDDPCLRIPARYGEAQTGAFSSDVPVADGDAVGWTALERRYGILLDPGRLAGEPAAVEGAFGRGKVFLSLVHFDTPQDRNGAVVLRNLWQHLASSSPSPPRSDGGAGRRGSPGLPRHGVDILDEIQRAVRELIDVGARNFLWYWRNPLILQWRRGVRGLEYATLAVMAAEIARCLGFQGAPPGERSVLPDALDPARLTEELREIRERLIPFCAQAERLLVRERFALALGPLSPVECADREVGGLRQELFGRAMSHGGLFKGLIDRMDRLLYCLLQAE